jgi:hypothetical protein
MTSVQERYLKHTLGLNASLLYFVASVRVIIFFFFFKEISNILEHLGSNIKRSSIEFNLKLKDYATYSPNGQLMCCYGGCSNLSLTDVVENLVKFNFKIYFFKYN